MERLPDATLNAIVSAPNSQYTEDAREAAATVLRRRAADGSTVGDSSSDVTHQVSYAVDDALLKPFRVLRALRAAVDGWQERTLPAGIPLRVRDLFWVGMTSALPAIAAIFASVRSATDTAEIARELASSSLVTILAVGAAGLILSYGVLTERSYPRLLAVPFVAVLALRSLRPPRREEDESAVELFAGIAWSYQTIKYLLKSSEAVTYYEKLRHRSQHSRLRENEEALPPISHSAT
jgi:hypothetical protein